MFQFFFMMKLINLAGVIGYTYYHPYDTLIVSVTSGTWNVSCVIQNSKLLPSDNVGEAASKC